MISDDEGSYISKYQQANNGCQSERAANEDSSDGRLLSDTNGSLGPEESIISRKPILEQDRFLPIANISRLMKNVIPRSGKVAKDAKECVQECVSEFISFITSEACDRCLSEKRKTITGEDIIGAFASLGFDNYVDPLNAYVKKFREAFRTERGNETLMVETPGSHSGLLDKLNTHDPNESTSAEVFTIQSEPGPGSSSCASQILFTGDDDADGSLRVLSTGNVQHLQLLMDPATGQHYINVQSPNGTIQLLPVQVSAVNDSSAASVTLSSPDSLEGKPNDKNLPDFGTNNYQPSTSEPGHLSSTPYKQVTQLRHCTGEQSRNGASFGIDKKHDEAERSTSNPQNQQQQHQMHCNIRQFGHREQRRKRSHESVEYISLD